LKITLSLLILCTLINVGKVIILYQKN